MRWTSRPSTRIIATWIVIAIGSILACAILLAGTPPDKHLAVYSVAANYSLPLVQREGRLYVGLLEVLEPLGKVSAKSEGKGWRLHYNNVEGDFRSKLFAPTCAARGPPLRRPARSARTPGQGQRQI